MLRNSHIDQKGHVLQLGFYGVHNTSPEKNVGPELKKHFYGIFLNIFCKIFQNLSNAAPPVPQFRLGALSRIL